MDDEPAGVDGLGFGSYVWADEVMRGLILEVRSPSTSAQRLDLNRVRDSNQINAVAGSLVELLGPAGSMSDVQALLSRGDLDVETLWEGLEAHLDLPELSRPEPEHCVVLTRADAAVVRLAAAFAGPTWMAVASKNGWWPVATESTTVGVSLVPKKHPLLA